MKNSAFIIGDNRIEPGCRATLELPTGRLYTHAPMTIPVHVVNGKKPGPRLFISAAIHGDEINGVEIIRRVLNLPVIKRMAGTLIAVPMVNVHGLLHHSRYLPDRRDLNRSFPGSEKGSLAARLAYLFMEQIVRQSSHGIDLHTGALHRSNLPQIRANLDDTATDILARAFGVPVIISANVRDGSLREAAAEHGIPMLLYEAGEALRFDEVSIRAGVKGIVNVMRQLEMLTAPRKPQKLIEPVVARSSVWVRAPESGILRTLMPMGSRVSKGDLMGVISDPFGEQETQVVAPNSGIIIGKSNLPLVNEGDALFNIARFGDDVEDAEAKVDEFQEAHSPETPPTPDADGPIM